jgi:hypothetical protein
MKDKAMRHRRTREVGKVAHTIATTRTGTGIFHRKRRDRRRAIIRCWNKAVEQVNEAEKINKESGVKYPDFYIKFID